MDSMIAIYISKVKYNKRKKRKISKVTRSIFILFLLSILVPYTHTHTHQALKTNNNDAIDDDGYKWKEY